MNWLPTRALGRAVLVSGVLLFVAAVTGRFDLVVLAAPVALGTAWALARRPTALPTVELLTDDPLTVEGGPVSVRVGVGDPDPVRYDFALVRLRLPRWITVPHGDRPYIVDTQPGAVVDVPLAGTARRWGRHWFGPATVHAVASDGLLVSPAVVADEKLVSVYPDTAHFAADEVMPRAAGLVGLHRSRRPGEGGELAGVRLFGPGDRLRRIDWRVSLRTRELHVAATLSDRDAELVVLLDVLTDAGVSGGIGGPASVLDTTVRAAAGIAEHYLLRGDRVAVLEFGYRTRWLRPRSGRRQYLTILEWLLDVAPSDIPPEQGAGRFGTHLLPGNALIVVLTPLIDPRTAELLARLVRAGRFVIAVDTLAGVRTRFSAAPWLGVARTLWSLERENTLWQLREHGVPVVEWAGPGSLDLVLRDVARLATGPRVGVR